MKKCLPLLCLLVLLCGCSSNNDLQQQATKIRAGLLKANSISFSGKVTASFPDEVFEFGADYKTDNNGKVYFEIKQPTEIAGITGSIGPEGGKIEFDGLALDFGILSQQLPSPIGGPYIFLQAIKSGYIQSYSKQDGMLYLSIRESYQSDAMMVEVYFDENELPAWAEISQAGRRILTISFTGFNIQ